jgi:hypothetical protein
MGGRAISNLLSLQKELIIDINYQLSTVNY